MSTELPKPAMKTWWFRRGSMRANGVREFVELFVRDDCVWVVPRSGGLGIGGCPNAVDIDKTATDDRRREGRIDFNYASCLS